jgi:hypothetical protein
MTDLDKDWSRYSAEEVAAGRTPSFSGFQAAKLGARAQLTYRDVAMALIKDNPNMSREELNTRVGQIIADQQRFLGGQSTAAGKYKEGQESKDRAGKPIVFQNGQWVYK